MNWKDVLSGVLRGLSLGATVAGQPLFSGYLDAVANLVDANADVEAHMKLVTEKLAAGPIVDADFEDAFSRIKSDLDRLNAS